MVALTTPSGTVDHSPSTAMQLKENQRRLRLCLHAQQLASSLAPMDHGPTYRDTSFAQFGYSMLRAFLAKVERYLLLGGIHDVHELKTGSHAEGKMGGKSENIARSLERSDSAENALDGSGLAIGRKRLRP